MLELKDILSNCGCKPFAGAAFIGEHSFSSLDTPVAEFRPDADDVEQAKLFGQRIQEKLFSVLGVEDLAEVAVPGDRPYREVKPSSPVDFIDINENCTSCGTCEELCPVHAIDLKKGILHDTEVCIHCCACIKLCPQGARTMKESPVKESARRLYANCQARKEPEFFF